MIDRREHIQEYALKSKREVACDIVGRVKNLLSWKQNEIKLWHFKILFTFEFWYGIRIQIYKTVEIQV